MASRRKRRQHVEGEVIAFRTSPSPPPAVIGIDEQIAAIDAALADSIRPVSLMWQFVAWRRAVGLSLQVEAARAEVDFFEFLEVFDLIPVESSSGLDLGESDYCEALASMWRSVSKQIGRNFAKRTRPTRDKLVRRLRDKMTGDNRVQWIDFSHPLGGKLALAA